MHLATGGPQNGGFKYWNWKLKKDDCNSSFNWDTQNILGIVEYLLRRNPGWISI